VSRRAGFDSPSPPSDSERVGAFEGVFVSLAAVARPSRQNGRVPRRNNARRDERPQAEGSGRTSGLGSHWRADGLPKSAFATQNDALTAALIRRQESGVDLNVYRCDVCSAWHMGKPQRREPGAERKK
jgi:hypothetical protein